MHTRWLRAPRSAAHRIPTTYTYSIGTTPRPFHASAIARHNPTSNSSANTPGSDSGKPDKDDSTRASTSSSGEAAEALNEADNVSTETAKTATGETQGRKKRSSPSSLRSRLARNRSLQELPPVDLPKLFLKQAITRSEDLQSGLPRSFFDEQDVINTHGLDYLESDLNKRLFDRSLWDGSVKGALKAGFWNESDVEKALQQLSLGQTDYVRRRSDLVTAAAHWAVVDLHTKTEWTSFKPEQLLRSRPKVRVAELRHLDYCYRKGIAHKHQDTDQLTEKCLNTDFCDLRSVAAMDPSSIEELMASIKSELEIKPPTNVRNPASLQRPATIGRFDYVSGPLHPSDAVKYIGRELGADVLYLSPHVLSTVLAKYLGQDIIRAPSPLTQMGYRAAVNSWRVKAQKAEDVDDDGEGIAGLSKTFTIVMGQDKKKTGLKASPLQLMDQYLNGSSSQEKNDERWEDLKLNTALEEIVHAALPEAPKRPLLVHLHDFVALSMDSEIGSTILSKLRKIVDNLWIDGRKIALVGTCATKGTPGAYMDALATASAIERVINVTSIIYSSESQIITAAPADEEVIVPISDRIDFWLENQENLINVLSALAPQHEADLQGMAEMIYSTAHTPRSPPASWGTTTWTTSIAPLSEIHRVAMAIIGSAPEPSMVCNMKHWSAVICWLNDNDATVEKQRILLRKALEGRAETIAASKASNGGSGSGGSGNASGILAAMGKMSSQGSENYEERLLSGLIQAKDIRTTFADVHAPTETIESIKMLTTLSLIRPEAFSYGVLATDRIPGALLYGPPGTGKTLLAKAVAKESGASMIEVSGASINNMYVGESEKNVRALFALAKKKAPAVIFIDEADALLGTRGRDRGSRRETLNQFLREWDGMNETKAFIMVATNRPFDLDEAVLRRLPRRLLIDLPTEKDRAAILKIHLKGEKLAGNVELDKLAKQTPLYSGSDLKNVCVAAAMAAVKEELDAAVKNQSLDSLQKKRVLDQRHFEKALKEISASMSDDMATLGAIKKFDEKYGDGMKRRKKKGMGFEFVDPNNKGEDEHDVNEGRVRKI